MAGESRRAVFAAIAGNLAIAIVKFIAAALTGSSAMISEGIHSVVDMGNGGLLYYGIRQSSKPADRTHPFGHGRELYFWSLIVAISIFGIGGGMSVYEGIIHLSNPAPVEDATLAYVVLLLSFALEGTSFLIAYKEFRAAKGAMGPIEAIRTGKDPSLFTVVFEDSAALIGLVVAFVGVFGSHTLRLGWIDGAASIVIGLLLASVALWLAYESKGLLVGEGADEKMVSDLDAIVMADADVAAVGPILSMYNGPHDVLLNLEVEFRQGLSAESIHKAIHRIEDAVTERYPDIDRIFIEVSSLHPSDEAR